MPYIPRLFFRSLRTRAQLSSLALLIVATTACAESRIVPEGVRQCPLLVVGEGADTVSYGGIAGRSDAFKPGACVEVYVDDVRIAKTKVTSSGTFAVQFQVPGDARSRRLELRLDDVAGDTNERYSLAFPDETAATIEYEPDTTPLLAYAGGRLDFTGSLRASPDALPIDDVWFVNWSNGAVAEVRPTPQFDIPFSASVSGSPGHAAAVVSAHGANQASTGGCWWPMGGGGFAPRCTAESILAGTCVSFGSGTCTGRGCDVLDVDERRSSAPPPELPGTIPVTWPDGGPPDAGPPDAGPPDLGHYDAVFM